MPLQGWALVALGSLLLPTVVACSSDSTPTGLPFGGRPPSPGTLALQVQGYDTFRLQWEAPLGPVDGFFVEGHVDTEIVPFQEWPGGRVPAGRLETTIVLDASMPELVPLAFRVRSFIGSQVSEPTNAVVFDTPVWPPADAAGLSGNERVQVSWNAGSRIADRILIDRLSSPDAGTAIRRPPGARKNSSLPSRRHRGRVPPPWDIRLVALAGPNCRAYTSGRPETSEEYATHWPSGENRGDNSWNGVATKGRGVPAGASGNTLMSAPTGGV